MGTPDFAVLGLLKLIQHHEVVAVYTQPDRPAGRGHKLAVSPVKAAALAHGLEVQQPTSLRTIDAHSQLQSYGADIFVVAAYGLILPKAVLDMPRLGCINIHASLLPKYRGASPIHAALLNGDSHTGITIMHMDAGIDTGDMILQKSLDILPQERLLELQDRMANLGAECVLEALALLGKGIAPRTPQNHDESCYAPMIKKNDGHINWNHSTQQIINCLRALDPWPGLYCMYNGQPLKIWGIEAVSSAPSDALPGTILAADSSSGLLIKTGDGAAKITEIQPSGKKRMATYDYLRGQRMEAGAVFC